jgi:hypothetical protein
VPAVLQDVAHQLHVLLVVFDDQDRAHVAPFALRAARGSRQSRVAPGLRNGRAALIAVHPDFDGEE